MSHLEDRAEEALSKQSTVFIADGFPPPVVKAFTVLITSPKRDRWWEFNKETDATLLAFPVLSRDEIDDMQRSCFPHRDAEGVWERYDRWGGIPRYVLGKVDDVSQKYLANAVNAATVQLLEAAVSEEGIEGEASGRLVHIKTAGELGAAASPRSLAYYSTVRTELGSTFIAEQVYDRLHEKHRDQLRAFLDTSAGNPLAATLRGGHFEREAPVRLAQGGKFNIRRLPFGDAGSDGGAQTLDLAAADLAKFTAVAELNGAGRRDKLMCPKSKMYGAIDAVFPDDNGVRRGVANFTVSTSHNIELDPATVPGLEEVAAALDWRTDPIPFYWVVPEDVYPNFKGGGFRMKVGAKRRLLTAAEAANHPLASRVQQYVLCMPRFVLSGRSQ